jgi:phosphatidylserine decarboxylase
MSLKNLLTRAFLQEDLNFLLTNRIPRRLATRFMGWFSQLRQPLVRDLSIALWKRFTDLDLAEAKKVHFDSMHDCFIRELKPGARPVDADPSLLTSPCDAIVGQCGRVDGTQVFQAKGFPYELRDLLGDSALVDLYRDGCYATLRITASMYHRFHAPHDCAVEHVTYFSGDTWNVNPIALKRVERLFCRNERAAIRTRVGAAGHVVTLVPVAAILVAGIRLHFADVLLDGSYKGPHELACKASYRKGEEMGWFQHGSTIIVFAPRGFTLVEGIAEGVRVRVGNALMRMPEGGIEAIS